MSDKDTTETTETTETTAPAPESKKADASTQSADTMPRSEFEAAKAEWKAAQNKIGKQLDEALASADVTGRTNKDLEAKILDLEGKSNEATVLRNKELTKQNKDLLDKVIKYERDDVIQKAFASQDKEFANTRSADIALLDVKQQLKYDAETQSWQSGNKDINQIVKDFVESEDNYMLFKAPQNKGTSATANKTNIDASRLNGASAVGARKDMDPGIAAEADRLFPASRA